MRRKNGGRSSPRNAGGDLPIERLGNRLDDQFISPNLSAQRAAVAPESIDRARQSDILAVAQRYGALKRAGAGEHVGPCPVCGGKDRFSVNVKKQLWNCRGCGKGGDAIALVRHVDGVTFAQAVERLTRQQWTPMRTTLHRREPDDTKGDDRNVEIALRIFDGAGSILHARAERAKRYLLHWRNIDIDQIPDLDDVLRFEPRCPFNGDKLPCLISLVRDIITDKPRAIQRIALDADGQKIDRRSLGPTRGGAIKLWPDAEITQGLTVGEGMETVAAAATRITHRGTLLQPAWALIDRANLGGFPVLAGIGALTILVDHDQSGDGPADASACARRWAAAGREAALLTPNTLGFDFNDIALGRLGGAP